MSLGLKFLVTDKDSSFLLAVWQIRQIKAHISELNLHAEAQAMEYKQKVSNCIDKIK